jgi:hypothetical protein
MSDRFESNHGQDTIKTVKKRDSSKYRLTAKV